MLKVYKGLIKILDIILNLLFVLQITILIVVFITAAYWFFDLINSSAFEFAKPLAESISDFVRLFYHEDIEIGGVYIDGSLLLFDILALIGVFLITKSKFYINRAKENLGFAVERTLAQIEKNFNKELKQKIEQKIQKWNNTAVLIQLEVKNMYIDSVWGGSNEGLKEKEDEVFKTFYSTLKSLTDCKFAKTDDKMLILLQDFSKIDNLLNFIDLSVKQIRANLKKEHWALFSYIAIDVYDNKTSFKETVYPTLEKLLTLKHKNEATALGNFNLRYKLLKNPMYTLFLKGSYSVVDGDVYALIKKN